MINLITADTLQKETPCLIHQIKQKNFNWIYVFCLFRICINPGGNSLNQWRFTRLKSIYHFLLNFIYHKRYKEDDCIVHFSVPLWVFWNIQAVGSRNPSNSEIWMVTRHDTCGFRLAKVPRSFLKSASGKQFVTASLLVQKIRMCLEFCIAGTRKQFKSI